MPIVTRFNPKLSGCCHEVSPEPPVVLFEFRILLHSFYNALNIEILLIFPIIFQNALLSYGIHFHWLACFKSYLTLPVVIEEFSSYCFSNTAWRPKRLGLRVVSIFPFFSSIHFSLFWIRRDPKNSIQCLFNSVPLLKSSQLFWSAGNCFFLYCFTLFQFLIMFHFIFPIATIIISCTHAGA